MCRRKRRCADCKAVSIIYNILAKPAAFSRCRTHRIP
nr:MAG TPA: hypothetical protein [Caudoviricetes sp.]